MKAKMRPLRRGDMTPEHWIWELVLVQIACPQVHGELPVKRFVQVKKDQKTRRFSPSESQSDSGHLHWRAISPYLAIS